MRFSQLERFHDEIVALGSGKFEVQKVSIIYKLYPFYDGLEDDWIKSANLVDLLSKRIVPDLSATLTLMWIILIQSYKERAQHL